MTKEKKFQQLKSLLEELPIVLTAAYGAIGSICGINIAEKDDEYGAYKKGDIIIDTDICTG